MSEKYRGITQCSTQLSRITRDGDEVYRLPEKRAAHIDPSSENHGVTLRAAEHMAHRDRSHHWIVTTAGRTYERVGRREWQLVYLNAEGKVSF
jgi:hypothetical protein